MSDEPIDRAVFAELQATTGAEFVVDLLDTFLEETPNTLAELRAACAEGNADRFRRAAHSLKSNANTFGAVILAARARELELAGLDVDPGRHEAAIAVLEAEHVRAAAALKGLRDG